MPVQCLRPSDAACRQGTLRWYPPRRWLNLYAALLAHKAHRQLCLLIQHSVEASRRQQQLQATAAAAAAFRPLPLPLPCGPASTPPAELAPHFSFSSTYSRVLLPKRTRSCRQGTKGTCMEQVLARRCTCTHPQHTASCRLLSPPHACCTLAGQPTAPSPAARSSAPPPGARH